MLFENMTAFSIVTLLLVGFGLLFAGGYKLKEKYDNRKREQLITFETQTDEALEIANHR